MSHHQIVRPWPSTPLKPTLIICLGKYGRDVGQQLAARLQLTETWLRQADLTRSLIARINDNGVIVPGLVRIMKVDWLAWYNGFYHPLASRSFLEDLEEVQDPAIAERQTAPSRIDSDWPAWEISEMRKRLQDARGQLLDAAKPLRQHDVPLQTSKDFSMRLLVVGSARESPTAELTSDLVELLGEIYVSKHHLSSGIQVLCYVGGTSLQEHVEAGGTEQTYIKNNYIGLRREGRRILGDAKKSGATVDGMPIKLSRLWPTPMEICYLLDAQLANLQVPTRGRVGEPDEVVVAAALGLDMIITTGADQAIRQMIPLPTALASRGTKAGPFATLGVASYSVDHPRLHRLVHSWLLGDFLAQALPQTKGEAQLPGNAETLCDENLEEQVQQRVNEALKEYEHCFSFAHLKKKVGQAQAPSTSMDDVVTHLDRCNPHQWGSIKNELSHLAPEVNISSLSTSLQDSQRAFSDALRSETESTRRELYDLKQAPLTHVYRMLQRARDLLRQEVNSIKPSLDVQDKVKEQQIFIDQLVNSYQQEESAKAWKIQQILKRKPTLVNTLGRAALIFPVLLATSGLISPFSLSLLLLCCPLALSTWLIVYTTHRWAHRSKLRRELLVLTNAKEALGEHLRMHAWQWALVTFISELSDLNDLITRNSRPGGLLAQLRDELHREDIVVSERMLERLFLDDQLKQELRNFAFNSRERGILWQQRRSILLQVAETAASSNQRLEDLMRRHVESLSQDLQWRITELVGSYFAHRGNRRLDDIYHTLSDAAELFLRYERNTQNDPTTRVALLGAYPHRDEGDIREIITQHPYVHVLESVDRLRWTFLRVYAGLDFDSIKFSVAFQLPP